MASIAVYNEYRNYLASNGLTKDDFSYQDYLAATEAETAETQVAPLTEEDLALEAVLANDNTIGVVDDVDVDADVNLADDVDVNLATDVDTDDDNSTLVYGEFPVEEESAVPVSVVEAKVAKIRNAKANSKSNGNGMPKVGKKRGRKTTFIESARTVFNVEFPVVMEKVTSGNLHYREGRRLVLNAMVAAGVAEKTAVVKYAEFKRDYDASNS